MAQRTIEVVVDVESKDVQFATDRVLSLQQQIRLLTKEIQNVDPSSESFKVLSKKLNDTRDQLGAVRARSGELFNSFSLLPGPIGEISSKLDGGISLLKTFSQFKLSDLQSQFKGLGTDLKEIFTAIGSIGEASDRTADASDNLTNSTNDLTSASNANAGANVQQVAAIENLAKAQTASVDVNAQAIESQKKYISSLIDRRDAITSNISADKSFSDLSKEQKKELATLNNQILKGNESLRQLQSTTAQATVATEVNTEVQQQNSVAQKGAAAGASANAAANTALAAAETAAATAGRILKGVLISLGIGAIIVLIGELISQIIEWTSSTKEAEAAQKKLNDELERTNELIELDKATFERANAERIANLKATGATEKQIREQQLKDRYNDYSRAFDNEREAIRQYNDALGKADQETLKKLGDNLTKRGEDTKNALSSYRVLESENRAALNKENEANAQKNKEKRDKDAADALAKRKAELDALIELEIMSENTRKDVLERLQKERLDLEKLTGAQLLLAQKNNEKKVTDSLKEDVDKRQELRLKSIDAIIEKEQSASEVDIERLKKLLLHKRDIELENTELILEERQALVAKYEKDIRDIENKARENKLLADIAANEGNFEVQTQLYKDFQKQAIESETLNAEEKLRIIQETNDKILELNDRRIADELVQIDNQLMNNELSYSEYFSKQQELYNQEIQRTKDLFKNKEITEEQYNQRIKEFSDARNSIRQAELESQVALFQAIGSGLSSLSQIVGEQTKSGKALAVAAALINTYAAIAGQLAAFAGVPIPGYAIAQAIATGLVGFVQVRKILATPIPGAGGGGSQGQAPPGSTPVGPIQVQAGGRARGGFVSGQGTGTSDSIPAMLSNGEFVVNARSTSMFGGLLNAINSAGTQPRLQFALGGPVTPENAPTTGGLDLLAGMTERPIKTYVVANEMSNQQQFDRTIKSRSLI
jgi:hypothetical protein